MASNNYSAGVLKILNQTIDYVNDDIQALVVNSSHTFDKTDDFVNDIVANEVSGTGYSRTSLANKSIVQVTGTPDEFQFRADDLTFTAIDTSPDSLASLVIFKQVNDDTDSPIIANVDFPDITTNGNNITIEFTNSVVFKATNPIV